MHRLIEANLAASTVNAVAVTASHLGGLGRMSAIGCFRKFNDGAQNAHVALEIRVLLILWTCIVK